MFEDFIKKIFGKRIDSLAIWVRENIPRSSLVILVGIFLPVIIPKFYAWLNNLDFSPIFNNLYNWLTHLYWLSKLFLSTSFVVFGLVWYEWRTVKKSRRFIEKFRDHLENWAIPQGAEWSIVSDSDVSGKVLSVAKSGYPGILKECRGWYDYEISFETKIKHDNFTVLVRAKDKFNGVMLQFKHDKLRPHYLINGVFVVDDLNEETLQVTIPDNTWIKVKIKVRGDYIDIFMNGIRITYKIQSKTIPVPQRKMQQTMYMRTLAQLETEARRILELQEEARKLSNVNPDSLEAISYLVFDFDVGTIGFREDGAEKALFRNIQIEKYH